MIYTRNFQISNLASQHTASHSATLPPIKVLYFGDNHGSLILKTESSGGEHIYFSQSVYRG